MTGKVLVISRAVRIRRKIPQNGIYGVTFRKRYKSISGKQGPETGPKPIRKDE